MIWARAPDGIARARGCSTRACSPRRSRPARSMSRACRIGASSVRRLATLESIADVEVLPIDADVAAEWARLRVHLAHAGRRINVNDLWIAATAAAHGLPVITQDEDFDALDGVVGVAVIRV
jgi:predicted nucleic acid-binding protein